MTQDSYKGSATTLTFHHVGRNPLSRSIKSPNDFSENVPQRKRRPADGAARSSSKNLHPKNAANLALSNSLCPPPEIEAARALLIGVDHGEGRLQKMCPGSRRVCFWTGGRAPQGVDPRRVSFRGLTPGPRFPDVASSTR